MTLIVDVVEAPSGAPVELTGQQAAKTLCSFNGTGTVAIRDSFNVSSLVDNGTGNYTINFTSSMTDGEYVHNALGSSGGGSSQLEPQTAPLAGSVSIDQRQISQAQTDTAYMQFVNFGDLA